MNRRFSHMSSLDGVRGLAVLIVVLFHSAIGLRGGFLGVDVFFVLSGFLITSILIAEWDQHGGISLSRFYARRALRLLPALVVMLSAMALVVSLVAGGTLSKDTHEGAVVTLLYVANWAGVLGLPTGWMSHTWSLAIEEQFYLLWPVVLIVVLRCRVSWKATSVGLVAAILGVALWRNIVWSGDPWREFLGTDTHGDGLLTGALVAVLWSAGLVRPTDRLARALPIGAWCALACLAAAVVALPQHSEWTYRAGLLAINVAAGISLLALVINPPSLLVHALEWSGFTLLGRVSYGLYLWHVPIFDAVRYEFPTHWYTFGLPIALALVLAATTGSYVAIERPCLRLKTRFDGVRRIDGEGRVGQDQPMPVIVASH